MHRTVDLSSRWLIFWPVVAFTAGGGATNSSLFSTGTSGLGASSVFGPTLPVLTGAAVGAGLRVGGWLLATEGEIFVFLSESRSTKISTATTLSRMPPP